MWQEMLINGVAMFVGAIGILGVIVAILWMRFNPPPTEDDMDKQGRTR